MGILYEIIHNSNMNDSEKKSFPKLLVDKVISVSSGTADRKLREYNMLQEKTTSTGTSMV